MIFEITDQEQSEQMMKVKLLQMNHVQFLQFLHIVNKRLRSLKKLKILFDKQTHYIVENYNYLNVIYDNY